MNVWAKSDYHMLGVLDGRIVSIVLLFLREIRVGKQFVTVAGVGGVATHPR